MLHPVNKVEKKQTTSETIHEALDQYSQSTMQKIYV